ncbi:MAG: prepilin-type N-terminal cleavage/methylation domain-containing protein [Erysipelothrix sp.]|nr:prepilin-type N-terminal cleavage/methylation domain-containing protein [Erysipelothrix sp.]
MIKDSGFLLIEIMLSLIIISMLISIVYSLLQVISHL